LNAYRADLADVRLQDRVMAARYTEGRPGRIARPVVPSRMTPDRARPRDTEYLFGEPVTLFDTADGWAWVQSLRDGYVGYVPAEAVVHDAPEPTHRLTALRSHLYPAPELKRFAADALTFGALVTVVETSDRWARIADGQWLYAAHLSPVDTLQADPATVALRFRETPYLWGGRSSEGLDCSALIQFALEACGVPCPRDTDMQEAAAGVLHDPHGEDLQRGDLVFWPGHVGIMLDSRDILHANATDMSTQVWTLADLTAHIERIEGNPVRTIRRP
jgi:cell wall-associated NlpC family hydrolase